MKVILKKNKICLSEEPIMDVPEALLLLRVDGVAIKTIDVVKGKKTYKFPSDIKIKDIKSLYLKIH